MRKLGGSDIPKLMGISPYGGPFEVFQRVVNGVESEWSPRMERGTVMEPVLRSLGQQHFGLDIEPHCGNGDARDYYDHPSWDFARA